MSSIRLAAFAGINNNDDLSAGTFQPPNPQSTNPAMFLAELHGGYITDDRRIKAFPGASLVAIGNSWGAGIDTHFGLLMHDQGAGAIVLNPGDEQEVLVSGLTNAPMKWVYHQGLVYWACGEDRGRIMSSGVNLPWALPQAPTPNVTAIPGTMPVGRYLVSVTWLDVTNAESGCAPSAEITLLEPGALRVGVDSIPANAAKVRIYVSPPNGQHPALVADVLPTELPYNVTIAHEVAGTNTMITLRTQGLVPMPVGSGFTTRGGFLLTWIDNILWFSAGAWTHLCDAAHNLFVFPSTVLYAVGLDDGVWVITENTAFWISGANLLEASITPNIANREYAAGGVRINAAGAFGVQSALDVAMFASSKGLVMGTNDGQMVAPFESTQKWDVHNKTAELVLCNYEGVRLIVVNMTGA